MYTLLIDPPSPFDSKTVILAFLKEYRTGPDRNHPDAKKAVAGLLKGLRIAERKDIFSKAVSKKAKRAAS